MAALQAKDAFHCLPLGCKILILATFTSAIHNLCSLGGPRAGSHQQQCSRLLLQRMRGWRPESTPSMTTESVRIFVVSATSEARTERSAPMRFATRSPTPGGPAHWTRAVPAVLAGCARPTCLARIGLSLLQTRDHALSEAEQAESSVPSPQRRWRDGTCHNRPFNAPNSITGPSFAGVQSRATQLSPPLGPGRRPYRHLHCVRATLWRAAWGLPKPLGATTPDIRRFANALPPADSARLHCGRGNRWRRRALRRSSGFGPGAKESPFTTKTVRSQLAEREWRTAASATSAQLAYGPESRARARVSLLALSSSWNPAPA